MKFKKARQHYKGKIQSKKSLLIKKLIQSKTISKVIYF